MSIPIETVRTDRFSMRYFCFGTGERILVILPGLSIQSVTGAAEAVEAEYAPMAEDFTIYVFDRRTELPPVYSVRDMARDTALAMQTLGLRDVCLFGASQGGMMAQVIAIEYPELVRRLVLGSTSSRVREEQNALFDRWIKLAGDRDKTGLYLDFAKAVYPPAVFEQSREMILAAAEATTDEDLDRFIILARGIKGFSVTEELDRIQCPVLAIGVYEDAILDSDATMEIAVKMDLRPDFRLYMYIGYGHAAYDTAPDYRDRMLRFLRE